LVLSFYYHPDLSAGSFRATALVRALREKLPANAHIDVVTTLPNRYSTFNSEASERESSEGLDIHRLKLPGHKSGMADQAKAYLYFAKEVRAFTNLRQYELIFVTSGRLMSASLGALVARRQKAKLYLDIRDIFVDTINDVLPRKFSLLAKPLFSLLEHWTIGQANKVNLVSRGFKPYFDARYPAQKFSFFTNGIDDEFISAVFESNQNVVKAKPVSVLYAGNIGEGQGLHAIVPGLAQRMAGRVNFKLIGDGGRKAALKSALEQAGVTNVELLPPVKRDQLIQAYRNADVLFLHLNDFDAFKKVLPSKLFEYAATGKPIWAGVSGHAAEFVKSEISNAAVFNPCNPIEADEAFSSLTIANSRRQGFVDKFARVNIMEEMADDVLSLVRGKL
jgi:hypothetical protein